MTYPINVIVLFQLHWFPWLQQNLKTVPLFGKLSVKLKTLAFFRQPYDRASHVLNWPFQESTLFKISYKVVDFKEIGPMYLISIQESSFEFFSDKVPSYRCFSSPTHFQLLALVFWTTFLNQLFGVKNDLAFVLQRSKKTMKQTAELL